MAKMSRAMKETIQTIIVILVVILLVIAYIVYPLNRTKAIMGRADLDDYSEDSTLVNDPTFYIEAGLPADSFSFEADAMTSLACLKITPDSAAGTAILLAFDNQSRDSLLPLVEQLYQNHINVVTYDQRATSLSGGKYRGDGQLEAKDLLALLSTLEIRDQIIHPLSLIGFETGADAVLLAAQEDPRIEKVVAINPYLTTKRLQNILHDKNDTYWFPFSRTVMWWWYNMRSGYAEPYREVESIKAVSCPTLIILEQKYQDDEEVGYLKDLSGDDKLKLQLITAEEQINDNIINFVVDPVN